MKKKIFIATLVPLLILPLATKMSPSQSNQKIAQSSQLVNNTQNPSIQQKPQVKPDYMKVMEITNWNEEISKYFIYEANNKNVSIFNEALPIINVETHGTYDFNLIHYNSNGTYDKGIFQINDLTYKDIIKGLKAEGRQFNSWSRLNYKFNISAGIYWIAILKDKGFQNSQLFTSYNRGIYGAKKYANRNGTYSSRYSRKIEIARNKIKNSLIE